jgi:organic radical activating enzyme
MAYINTEAFSIQLRRKGIDLDRKAISITNFLGSEQEEDFTEPANCKGYGRIRHFKLHRGGNWPQNPLPILPAAKALGVRPESEIRAQVFQNSICNWRCWYCFVDFDLLSGNPDHSSYLSCDELLDLYLAENDPPKMIDLTGGQPDLTPEWIPWMMESLANRGLQNKIFLWSDDNLSNDYLWRYLTDEQISLMTSYSMYSRVCCFKGLDEISFSLNTKADPRLFDTQFDLCQRLLDLKLDLYCYITLTAETKTDFKSVVPKFLDRLQKINEKLPLRIVPLEIFSFSPMQDRMNDQFLDMIKGQHLAVEIWKDEIEKRFSKEYRDMDITNITIY